jgi:hypothetical protein
MEPLRQRQPPLFYIMIVHRNLRYFLVALQSENISMARKVAKYTYVIPSIIGKISPIDNTGRKHIFEVFCKFAVKLKWIQTSVTTIFSLPPFLQIYLL